ncbi:hypothetical protein BV210_17955 (plasmid) [Halorientalis sp. IM1011]|nr:hypothetical protein BV210_17955 [Halorientalis sp. IM1011]
MIGRNRLRETVDRIRRSLFGATGGGEQRLLTESGRVDTDGLDIDDETVVLRLLTAKGGRIRQSSVVERTDWSPAKVSRLLTRMEKRNRIDRVRMGREKIVVSGDGAS